SHMFGSVRRVLDIWEVYAGGPFPWHFQLEFPRLELISYVPWNNAHFGSGFCECGEDEDDGGVMRPFALNFDIIAHEVGHGLVFSMAGIPSMDALTTDYLAFHESASDLVAIVSSLHFDSFIDHVLSRTKGDLYVENEINRIGELSGTRQIRSASNATKLSDLPYRNKAPEALTGHELHELGQPLTGAVFDIAVEFFLSRLVVYGMITQDEAEETRRVRHVEDFTPEDRSKITNAFDQHPEVFKRALYDARDMLGLRLARSWHRLRPQHLTFGDAADALLQADAELTGTCYSRSIRECFDWRGIVSTE
ncbi:MAG: M36 family metallopeptidase, partial [Pseudomonadota bacterium]